MKNNKGLVSEESMMRFFKGKKSNHYAWDFETSKTLWEVKSCNLYNRCFNANQKRPFKRKPHKRIKTHQFGRFIIKTYNHLRLKYLADKAGKQAKYVFVLNINKQFVWKVLSWDQVVVNTNKRIAFKRVSDVFGIIK